MVEDESALRTDPRLDEAPPLSSARDHTSRHARVRKDLELSGTWPRELTAIPDCEVKARRDRRMIEADLCGEPTGLVSHGAKQGIPHGHPGRNETRRIGVSERHDPSSNALARTVRSSVCELQGPNDTCQ